MMNLIERMFNLKSLKLDFTTGLFPALKGCMALLAPRLLLTCDSDARDVRAFASSSIYFYASQVLNSASDTAPQLGSVARAAEKITSFYFSTRTRQRANF